MKYTPYIVWLIAVLAGITGGCYLATHGHPWLAALMIILPLCYSVKISKSKSSDDDNDDDNKYKLTV